MPRPSRVSRNSGVSPIASRTDSWTVMTRARPHRRGSSGSDPPRAQAPRRLFHRRQHRGRHPPAAVGGLDVQALEFQVGTQPAQRGMPDREPVDGVGDTGVGDRLRPDGLAGRRRPGGQPVGVAHPHLRDHRVAQYHRRRVVPVDALNMDHRFGCHACSRSTRGRTPAARGGSVCPVFSTFPVGRGGMVATVTRAVTGPRHPGRSPARGGGAGVAPVSASLPCRRRSRVGVAPVSASSYGFGNCCCLASGCGNVGPVRVMSR